MSNPRRLPLLVIARPALVGAALASLLAAVPGAAQEGPVVSDKGGGDEAAAEIVDDSKAPPEQDEALKLFVGTWKCTGTANTEAGQDLPAAFTITGKKDLGGRWLVVKTELNAKAKGSAPVVSNEVWGHSRARNQLVRQGADSRGAWFSTTSTGWGGAFLSFTGDTTKNAKPAREKLGFERKSDKELAVQFSVGPDELQLVFEGTCKR